MADVIALILDNPDLDVEGFWQNCQRTSNVDYVFRRLEMLQRALKSGTFRDPWQMLYVQPLSMAQVHSVLASS